MAERPAAPGYVRWVTRTLEEAGYETWAVGGAIRNTLLGLPSGDWDMATRAPPSVVRRLFDRTVPVGVEHGTVGILTREGILLEVTTFRKDVETFGRHAVVEFAETLSEDLARRDFTINAVAWHPLREEYRDPFEGRRDLDRKVLRTVGTPGHRFAEDYLRVLRGIRFAGRFHLRIEDRTWSSLREAASRLRSLSPERVREELLKVLSDDPRPSRALHLYAASGANDTLYPELSALEGVPRRGHDEELLGHSMGLADGLSSHRPMLRLASLLEGLGLSGPKGEGSEAMEVGEAGRAAALMIRNRFSNAEVREVTELLRVGLEPPLGLRYPSAIRQWLHRTGPRRLGDLSRIWLAKARLDHLRWSRKPGPTLSLIRRLRAEVFRRPPLALEDLALSGRDLISAGLKPGPHFGEILEDLLNEVLIDPDLNTREKLLKRVEEEFLEGRGGE